MPATVVQGEGLDATFLCQLPTFNDGTSAIEWQINGTSLRNVNAIEGQIRKGRGEATEALIIRALTQLNGTSIVCILYIIEPNRTAEIIESTPAILFVQGIS